MAISDTITLNKDPESNSNDKPLCICDSLGGEAKQSESKVQLRSEFLEKEPMSGLKFS